eukprot:3011558-Rhodomonas_salina.4
MTQPWLGLATGKRLCHDGSLRKSYAPPQPRRTFRVFDRITYVKPRSALKSVICPSDQTSTAQVLGDCRRLASELAARGSAEYQVRRAGLLSAAVVSAWPSLRFFESVSVPVSVPLSVSQYLCLCLGLGLVPSPRSPILVKSGTEAITIMPGLMSGTDYAYAMPKTGTDYARRAPGRAYDRYVRLR